MLFPPLELEPGEKEIETAYANLFRGWEGVGGKLYITNRRLRFESHAVNLQAGPTEIRLEEISSVGPRATLGFVPNGMRVETRDGRSYHFVVWRRQKLIDTIRALCAGKPTDED